jgi:hypothetical protein
MIEVDEEIAVSQDEITRHESPFRLVSSVLPLGAGPLGKSSRKSITIKGSVSGQELKRTISALIGDGGGRRLAFSSPRDLR